MRRTIKTTLLLLILSGFGATLVAQTQQGRRGMRGQDGLWAQNRKAQGQEMRIPDLTDEQKEAIQEIRITGQKEALPIRSTIAEKRARLQTLTTSEEYNEKEVNAMIDEIADLQADLVKLRESHRQKVRALLTDGQKVIFDSMSLCNRGGKKFPK